MKSLIIPILMLLLTSSFAYAGGNPKSYLIPQEFEFEGETYCYESDWTNSPDIKYGDFDGDGEKEIVVGFQARTKDDVHVPLSFYLIYEVIDGKENLIKTITGNDYFVEVKLIDLEKDNQPEIAIFSGGGAHHTDLSIYKYTKGDYKCIFDNGSACPVELIDNTSPPQIRIGRANWEKKDWCYADESLWEIHIWDGKKFVYSKKLSSSPQISENQEAQRYVDKVLEGMKKSE